MAILVDTGALELLRRRSPDVEKLAIRCFPPLICTHVAAEFIYGQTLANVSAAALLEARKFLKSFEILAPGFPTIEVYARVRADLKSDGITLPDPDYWIAAHAIEYRLPLVTTDSHFKVFNEIDLHLIDN